MRSTVLAQIVQDILSSFQCSYPDSELTLEEVCEYIDRGTFTTGGQGWLTDKEFHTLTTSGQNEKTQPLVALVDFLAKERVVIGGLTLTSQTSGEIFRVLKKCAWIDFQGCTIEMEDFPTLPFFYTFLDCTFAKTFRLSLRELEVSDQAESHARFSQIFRECTFNKSLVIDKRLTDEKLLNLFAALIVECEFESLTISGIRVANKAIIVKKNLDNPEKVYHSKNLSLHQVVFETDLELGGMVIDEVFISGCNFLGKVNSDFIETNSFLITDCKFESSFSSKYSQTKKLQVVHSSFNHFFSLAGANIDQLYVSQVSFQYALDSSEVQINQNLIFHGVVFNQPSNFLGVLFSSKALEQIDRETFRIIKHSFDSVGNQVEANRFYAYEMEAYRRELNQSGDIPEKWLLGFNALVSNHGQSYLRPMGWVLGAIILLWFLKIVHENNWLYKVCNDCNPCFQTVSNLFNGLVRDLPLFKQLMIPGIEFLSLIISLFISAFIWQALVAFRRHTKR